MGKSLNPADAQRKRDRLREVAKNKANRTAARSEKLFTNPAALKAELEKWRKLRPGQVGEDGEKLDPASIANRVRKLEEALETLLRKKRVRAWALSQPQSLPGRSRCPPPPPSHAPASRAPAGGGGGGGQGGGGAADGAPQRASLPGERAVG